MTSITNRLNANIFFSIVNYALRYRKNCDVLTFSRQSWIIFTKNLSTI